MSIQVKAYLNWANNQPEIRRFSVDSDASTSYEYLLEKIRSVYPSLKRANIQLFWKDDDEEIIIFSSDDELIEALTHIHGEFFRVYVKDFESDERNKTAGEEGVVHEHVTCDGCEDKVVGSRFKCSVCCDYDLCSSCEAKGLHEQHLMIRIRNPETTPMFPWFMNMPWMRGQQYMGRGQRRGGSWRGSFHGFRGGRGGHPGFPYGHPAGFPQCPRGFPQGPPTSRGCPPRSSDACGESSQTSKKKKEDQTEEEEEEPTHLFHQFGQALNTFLEPYGIDVHTYADNQGQNGQHGQDAQHGKCEQDKHESQTPPNTPETEAKTTNAQNDSNEEPMDEALSPHNGDHTYVVVGTTQSDGKSEDSSLAEAVKQMKAMGFDDDGGWLSQLLKAKNYDINKVLDTLPPQKKK